MNSRSVIVVLLCASCSTGGEKAPPPAAGAQEPDVPGVEVVPVVSRRLDTTTLLPAEINAYESVAILPRVSGFVDEVLVDRGDRVRKGQLLARLSAPELVAQRAEAESKLAATRSTYERTRTAAQTPGVVASNDVEIAEAALRADEARVRSLQALEGYLLVRAPFDGTVTERDVHPGALMGPASGGNPVPMFRMESVDHLRITVAVPESDVGAIAEGASAEFVVRTWPGQRFSGVIRRVAHAVDPRTRTMPVELDYVNKDGKLAPGMFAEVAWPIRRDQPSLFVPASAIVQTTDRIYVNRVKDGVVEQVSVKRGATFQEQVEVWDSDLRPGDVVIRRGSEEWKVGTRVRAEQMAPATNR